MKILLIGKYYVEGFALHIEHTLSFMGHEVIRYEPGVTFSSLGGNLSKRWRQIKSTIYDLSTKSQIINDIRTRRLLKIPKIINVDLTIVCHDFLSPREVSLLKKATNSPIVLWFPDSISLFGKSYFLNSEYDALFFKDPYIVSVLSKTLKIPIYYLPECFNPSSLMYTNITSSDKLTYGCDIATVGNMYPYRAAFFKQLNNYKVRIWGNPAPLWMDISGVKKMIQHKYLADEAKAKAFCVAKIIVNNLHPAEIWGVNVRTFEIAGAGGFQLVDWRPCLDQLFNDGNEVISFRSMDDLIEKINYYLPEENQRKEIAANGYKRAINDHTYEIRLKLLLDIVFNGRKEGYEITEKKITYS